MKRKNLLVLVGVCFLLVFSLYFALATQGFMNPVSNFQSTQPTPEMFYSSSQISEYWSIYDDIANDKCEANSDFVVMIPPAGCTPQVVRSDLLAERNVPVFCQLQAVKVNPLIAASSVKSISFKGKYPEGVAGVSFHPARAAVKSYNTLIGSPIVNNIGYVVINLKRTPNESAIIEEISGNLTATIRYDAERAFGVGAGEFYLPVVSDNQWNLDYNKNSFWNGRGYLRASDIEGDKARILMYTDKDSVFKEYVLEKGETSNRVFFPGFYCRAGVKVQLKNVVAAEDKALLNVDGDTLWVRKGSKFLNGKCSVRDLDAFEDGTGIIEVVCEKERFEMGLVAGESGSFKGSNFKENVSLGQEVKGSWYLAYLGKTIKKFETVDDEFIIPNNYSILVNVEGVIGTQELSEISRAVDTVIEENYVKWRKGKGEGGKDFSWSFFEGAIAGKLTKYTKGVNLIIINQSQDTKKGISFQGILSAHEAFEEEVLEDDKKEIRKDFLAYKKVVEDDLVESFPSTKRVQDEKIVSYAEQAYFDLVKTAMKLKNERIISQEELIKIMEGYLNKYSGSINADYVEDEKNTIEKYETSAAHNIVYVNNENHYVGLKKFDAVNKADKQAVISIGGRTSEFYEGEIKEAGAGSVSIEKIDVGEVDLIYNYTKKNSQGELTSYKKSVRLKEEGDYKEVEGVKFYLKDTKVNEEAHIVLIPEIPNSKSDVNFTFNIGVEKRNIEITPEKAEKMMKNINETIEMWRDKNEQLERLVRGWKGVCLATSTILQFKSLSSGFEGIATARPEVMSIWRKKCDEEIKAGDKGFNSRDACYSNYKSEIEKDVKTYASSIQSINQQLRDSDDKSYASVEEWKKSDSYTELDGCIQVGKEDKEICKGDLKAWDEVRAYIFYANQPDDESVLSEGVRKDMANKLAYRIKAKEDGVGTSSFKTSLAEIIQPHVLDSPRKIGESGLTIKTSGRFINKDDWSKYFASSSSSESSVFEGDNTKIEMTTFVSGSKKYVVFGSDTSKMYNATVSISKLKLDKQVKNVESSNLEIIPTKKDGNCDDNVISNPVVRYYDHSKMAGYVPFDEDDGWYVYVKDSTSSLVSKDRQGYAASGQPLFYYLCNVGSDGEMDGFDGGDQCTSMNINTGSAGQFCGKSSSEISNLASCGEKALKQANQQFGKDTVRINVCGNNLEAKTTSPMAAGQLFECQDFMSIGDCEMLYRACDPVICPSSRCNLGGSYEVSNVIGSGIFGSLLLCGPHIQKLKTGVLPICLTGLHAGIDGYISILESELECLEDAGERGVYTGICDEITAVYKCEFFWRQISPLMQNLLPKIAEGIYTGRWGSASQGGGEYTTFQDSWNNMKQSQNYFMNEYASTSFTAFKYGNVQEIGSNVCKGFIGTSFPTSADVIDSMLEPESPSQFYAEFSEIPFTDATVPPTAQYKVFFHIYAGNERGAQYQVYLRDPPESSYYKNNQVLPVKGGFIAAGDQAQKSVDFTAPAGYKELCVVINAEEKCGFRQISSEIGVELLKNKWVEDQGNQRYVDSEDSCISGKPSAWGMASLNVQEGIEESVNPDISLRGIVRVCSTENPGKGFEEERWQDIGHCGNPSLRCWQDLKSVKEDAKTLIDKSDTYKKSEEYLDAIENNQKENDLVDKLDENQTGKALTNLKNAVEKLKLPKPKDCILECDSNPPCSEETCCGLICSADEIAEKGNLNADQAQALYLKSEIFKIKILRSLEKVGKTSVEVKSGKEENPEKKSTEEENKEEDSSDDKIDDKIETNSGTIESVTIEGSRVVSSSDELKSFSVPSNEKLILIVENGCDSINLKRVKGGGFDWLIPDFLNEKISGSNDKFSLQNMKNGEKQTYELFCKNKNLPTQSLIIVLRAEQTVDTNVPN